MRTVQWFMETLLGRLILFGYTWALIHHMLGGIRHLIWDLGYGFGPVEREWLTVATLVGSIGFTILIWIVGYWSWEASDDRARTAFDAHAARPRPPSRLGASRHPAFLAPAPDLGRQHPADHRRDRHHHRRCSAAITPRWCRSSARRWSRSRCCCSSSPASITCGSACRSSSRTTCTTRAGSSSLLMANTFFSFAVGLAAVFAILKLSFGV